MAEAKAIWGTGRRKTAIARVRLLAGNGTVTVSGRPIDEYVLTPDQRLAAKAPLVACEVATKFDVRANVIGGGPMGQAEAVRHGTARALVASDETFLPK